jgi:succinate dehydrogenase / fumarate reductase flavoprotein subunit
LYAIGECDYQYHGANRLGANSLLSCIFSGLIVAPGIKKRLESGQSRAAASQNASLYESACKQHLEAHERLLRRDGDGENPYLIHQELGDVMTKAATVVRHNDQLREAHNKVCEFAERAKRCALSDSGNWANQNIVFAKALLDMFPLAKTILQGALNRDECRGAHYKPEFVMPSLTSDEPAERRRQAEAWCDQFDANNQKWLKSTIAVWGGDQPDITYEDVDTSLIPPRPRLYGLAGAEVIEEVWRERQSSRAASGGEGGH